MTLTWQKEDSPRWDADKQRLFGADELASVGFARPAANQPIADEWWRVVDDTAAVVGYGWLDQISFVGAPDRAGIGTFILDRLEREANDRGLNYVYNVVPATHPDRRWMTQWLTLHGFRETAHGDLRRRVGAASSAS